MDRLLIWIPTTKNITHLKTTTLHKNKFHTGNSVIINIPRSWSWRRWGSFLNGDRSTACKYKYERECYEKKSPISFHFRPPPNKTEMGEKLLHTLSRVRPTLSSSFI